MDPRERFSPAAGDYARYRPDYPDALVRACAEYAGLAAGADIVDIGCGTGISSRRFAAHGFFVTGVEPNREMLAKAREEGGADYREGDAANTGLPDRCADLIVSGQALHWFDLDRCADEWRRILRPPGCCAAFWNFRRNDGWQAEYERLLLEWSDQYADVRRAVDGGHDYGGRIKDWRLCEAVEEREFENAQRMDLATLIGRAHSSSYVIHGVADRAGFDDALRRLFEARAVDGHVEFRYRAYLLLWRFRGATD